MDYSRSEYQVFFMARSPSASIYCFDKSFLDRFKFIITLFGSTFYLCFDRLMGIVVKHYLLVCGVSSLIDFLLSYERL